MLTHRFVVPKSPQRVVVIGGSGFIGQELMTYLQTQGVNAIGTSSKQLDLSSPESVDQLKALVSPRDSVVFIATITPDRGRDTTALIKNLTMAKNCAAFLEQATFLHFVHIGSDALYDPSVHLVSESTPCNPSDFFGYMHLGRELIIKNALQKSKIPHTILRPSVVYGERDPHNSYGPNRFYRTALAEQKITLFGNGEEKRDHVHVRDVSRLISLCLAHQSEGVLNVATGVATSFYETAQQLVTLSAGKVAIQTTPRANPITHRHFDISALIQAFPSFHFIPLEEGLKMEFKKLKDMR